MESLLQYLEHYLALPGYPDYPTALNGLQVEGRPDVRRIVTAVDASHATIAEAVRREADLLLVHHGLFWDGLKPLTGRSYRRIRDLILHGVGLYSCHLPLDAHPEVGNCALLARSIGVEPLERLGSYKGAAVGWSGSLEDALPPGALVQRVEAAVGGPVRHLEGGPDLVRTVGVVTGGGGSFIAEAAASGLDAFVTGEGAHHNFFDAAEYGIHVLFAGHYATETFGVRALGDHLAERFDLDVSFVDLPTGL
jgi:dinuclear metal center YbgI/SA1388 family protein